jgi:hypothetical protein
VYTTSNHRDWQWRQECTESTWSGRNRETSNRPQDGGRFCLAEKNIKKNLEYSRNSITFELQTLKNQNNEQD